MNSMGDQIVVLNPDFLTGVDGNYMGSVAAAALVEANGRGAGGFVVRCALGNVDDDVLQGVLRTGKTGFRQRRRTIELGAAGFCGHVDGLEFFWRALVGDF